MCVPNAVSRIPAWITEHEHSGACCDHGYCSCGKDCQEGK